MREIDPRDCEHGWADTEDNSKQLVELNKRVCRKLGIEPFMIEYREGTIEIEYPDYIAHPEELLREMAKHITWNKFMVEYSFVFNDAEYYCPVGWVLDTTSGKLAKAVDEFLKEEEA